MFDIKKTCSFFRLFAVGGRDGSSCLRSVECFDPHTNKWSMCASMSKRRGGVGVATYNNFLYAVGGHDAPASNHCSRLSDCVERWVDALSLEKTHRRRRAVEMAVQNGECSFYSVIGWGLNVGLILVPTLFLHFETCFSFILRDSTLKRSYFPQRGLSYSIWRHLVDSVTLTDILSSK